MYDNTNIKISPVVKNFIENYINLIEDSRFEELYENAYEWLSDEETKQLTNVLESVLDTHLKDIILSVLHNKVEEALTLFVMDSDKHDTISFISLVRNYMNHLCGQRAVIVNRYLIDNPPNNSYILLNVDDYGWLIFSQK